MTERCTGRDVETLSQPPDILTSTTLVLLSISFVNCIYTVYFLFTGHSLDVSDNVLHDWMFPHHCVQEILFFYYNYGLLNT